MGDGAAGRGEGIGSHEPVGGEEETEKNCISVMNSGKSTTKTVYSPEKLQIYCDYCRVMMTKGMVFRYTWVYSKEDTMAHTCRPVVTS